jgi:hypothetical protein
MDVGKVRCYNRLIFCGRQHFGIYLIIDNPVSLGGLNIQSSALKYVAGTSISGFLSTSASYELLSPGKMRSGLKDPSYSHLTCNIGINGEQLAQCIDNMIETQKQDLNKTLIEDGINPYLTQKVIDLLRSIEQDQGRQVIVTTHSPVMLNDFKPDEIVFLWKDEPGASHCGKMFATDRMRYPLNALSPGEIWINLEKEQIFERMGVN